MNNLNIYSPKINNKANNKNKNNKTFSNSLKTYDNSKSVSYYLMEKHL
jgi:hypothetical protein